ELEKARELGRPQRGAAALTLQERQRVPIELWTTLVEIRRQPFDLLHVLTRGRGHHTQAQARVAALNRRQRVIGLNGVVERTWVAAEQVVKASAAVDRQLDRQLLERVVFQDLLHRARALLDVITAAADRQSLNRVLTHELRTQRDQVAALEGFAAREVQRF